MSSEFAEVFTTGAGTSGIDVGALPALPDADALETHAKALSEAGASINASIGAASRAWTGLSGAYQAPEEGLVLAGFSPIAYRAASLQGTTDQCSAALLSFAERTRDLKRRVEALRSDVGALDGLILANKDWQSKIDIVDQRRDTYDRCSALAQEILDSDAACASALNVMAGGEKVSAAIIPRHNLDSSTDVVSNAISHVQHFLGSDREIPDQPWGAATVSVRWGGTASVGQGALSALVGGAQGLYTLLGTRDKEEQTLAWQGLGALAGAVITTRNALSRADGKFSAEELNAMLTVGNAAKDVVYWDEWGRDPLYAAGGASVDIVGLFAGGAGVGLKAGSVAGKAGKAGAAAEKLGAASMDSAKLGKASPALGGPVAGLGTAGTFLSKPGSLALKISDMVMPKTTAKLLHSLGTVRVDAFVPDGKAAAADLVHGAKTAADNGIDQPAGGLRQAEPGPTPHGDDHADPTADATKDVGESSDASVAVDASDAPDAPVEPDAPDAPVEPTKHPDNPSKAADALYGEPRELHAEHAPYPEVTKLNRETMNLVSDPDAPWGRATDGTPFSKAEYDERFTQPGPAGESYHAYPPNDGAVPGTRWDYTSLSAFVRDHGTQLDRIGDPGGKYLGVMKDGVPASFEARSLPVGSLDNEFFTYRMAKDWPPGTEGWTVEVSEIARAFGREGGGSQLLVRNDLGKPVSIESLLERGVLE